MASFSKGKKCNIKSGTPCRKTKRDPHPQHHTPERQSDDLKAYKGIVRKRVRAEKTKSGKKSYVSSKGPNKTDHAVNAIVKTMRSQ